VGRRLLTASSFYRQGSILNHIRAQLQLRGFRFTNADLDDVVRAALTGLIQDIRQLNGA
jgi:hypothetical protein